MQVFVADDIGRETMTGVTVPAELGDIVNDIVMGCDKPENDTYRKTNGTCNIFQLYIQGVSGPLLYKLGGLIGLIESILFY